METQSITKKIKKLVLDLETIRAGQTVGIIRERMNIAAQIRQTAGLPKLRQGDPRRCRHRCELASHCQAFLHPDQCPVF